MAHTGEIGQSGHQTHGSDWGVCLEVSANQDIRHMAQTGVSVWRDRPIRTSDTWLTFQAVVYLRAVFVSGTHNHIVSVSTRELKCESKCESTDNAFSSLNSTMPFANPPTLNFPCEFQAVRSLKSIK